LPCKPYRTTGCNYFALSLSSPLASAKTCYAPAAAQAIIVLPAFARSLPADGREGINKIVKAKSVRVKKQELRKKTIKYKSCYNLQNKSALARQKSGPGSMACGGKHFFVLMFGYFASKVK
jgi:hypothetical protein